MYAKNPSKASYFNGGVARRKQVANWLLQELELSGLSFHLKEIRILLDSYDDRDKYKAVRLFSELMYAHGDETLKYILKYNEDKFGKTQIITSLMRNIFTQRMSYDKIRKSFRKLPEKTIEEIEQEKKEFQEERKDRKYIYGTIKGERVRVTAKVIERNGKPFMMYFHNGKFAGGKSI